MNCSVCGGPLLFSRVSFRCSCGAYVHAYCLDKHTLQAHRPEFEEGTVDLNGEFHPLEQRHEPASIVPDADEEARLAAATIESAGDEQAEAPTTQSEEEAEAKTDEESSGAGEEVQTQSEDEAGFVPGETEPKEENVHSGDSGEDGEERTSTAGE